MEIANTVARVLIKENPELLGIAIIQDNPTESDIRLMLGERSWVVISFLSRHEEHGFRDMCRTQNVSIEKIIKVRDVIEDYSLRTRTRYSEFISTWPMDTSIKGISFKEKFSHRNEISYWWLTDASVKQNESSQTFEYLCYLELLDATINITYDHCAYIGSDTMLSLLISRVCEKYSTVFSSSSPSKVERNVPIIYGIVARFWFAIKIFFAWVFFKLFDTREPKLTANVVGFYTIYPSTSYLNGTNLNDRNYLKLPNIIDKLPGYKSLFLVSFHPKSVRHWKTVLTSILSKQSSDKPNYVFMDRFLKFSDVLLVLMNLWFVIRYLILHKFSSIFRKSFRYLEVDIYELIGLEQARALLGNQLPDSIILSRLTERALNKYQMDHLFCFLELYPSARAIYYGASKSKAQIETVAYQHASINSMKLWYNYSKDELLSTGDKLSQFIFSMPIPDRYFFQGDLGRKIITDSGYPEERCFVTGSPRYESLAHIRDKINAKSSEPLQTIDKTVKPQTRQILVVPSLSKPDALELIEATLLAWELNRSEYDHKIPIQITIKPHPSTILTNELNALSNKYDCKCVSESSDNLYDLIVKADVVITSYSTAGDEAIALKTPVICYSGIKATMSSFLDIPAAPIVHDPEELDSTLKKIIYPENHPLHDPDFISQYRNHWQSLIDESFYKLDAYASDRIISALLRS